MPTTVALVRWHGGWSEIEKTTAVTAFGVREGFLSYGAQQSVEEVLRLTEAELSTMFAKNREQMTVEHRPADLSEIPYVGGYIPSDRVVADDFDGDPVLFPVLSVAVTEDDDGVVTFVPVVGDIIDGIEWLQQALRDSPRKKRSSARRRTPIVLGDVP